MVRCLARFAVTLAAGINCAAAWPQPVTQPGTGTSPATSISGTVFHAGTGAPMPDVSVSVQARANSGPQAGAASVRTITAVTGKDGKYALRDLPLATYRVVVTSSQGVPETKVVNLSGVITSASVDFRLEVYGTITGRVLDQNSEPVPRAELHLLSKQYYLSAVKYYTVKTAKSDDRGVYSFRSVAPGSPYFVQAAMLSGSIEPASGLPSDPKSRRQTVAITFYPGSTEIDGGQELTLRAGEIREDVDIHVSRTPSYCIDALLHSVGRSGEQIFEIRSWLTGAAVSADTVRKEKIRVCGLAPGRYRLLARSVPGTVGEESVLGTVDATVIDEDLAGADVYLLPAVTLAGRVVWGEAPPPEVQTAKLFVALESINHIAIGEDLSAQSSIPGEFRLTGVFRDDYALVTSLNIPGVYIKDIRYDNSSIMNRPLRLGVSARSNELEIVLSREGATVTAEISDEKGNPAPYSYVHIAPAVAASQEDVATSMVVGQVDQFGKYSSSVLPPGKYYVLATRERIRPTPEGIGWLLGARSRASEINLGPHATEHVKLVLIN